MKCINLVVIDGQNDFCDPKGSLYVPGAEKDMENVSNLVKKLGSRINDISVTLDSHHWLDIAHPIFWRNSEGKNPDPFTIISVDDVKNGVWQPALPSKNLREKATNYVEELDKSGKYALCIWPPHCIIGSWGHNIFPQLLDSLHEWCVDNFATLTTVTKGSNIFTEHYSAIKAEVPDAEDASTQINTKFVQNLQEADDVLITGEALSHCVANTFRDVAEAFGNDELVKKLVLLTDASSNVPSFDSLGEAFVNDLTAKGMRTTTTKDYTA